MKVNTLITIVYLNIALILIGLLGLLINEKISRSILGIGLVFFILNGSFLLLRTGNFYKSNEFKYAGLGFISFIIISLLFEIMHWPFSDFIVGTGYLLIALMYLLYMLKNKFLSVEKWMRFAFIVTLFTGGYFKSMHWPYNKELIIISILILSFLVGHFLINRKKITT